jgi:hypothetical protein
MNALEIRAVEIFVAVAAEPGRPQCRGVHASAAARRPASW